MVEEVRAPVSELDMWFLAPKPPEGNPWWLFCWLRAGHLRLINLAGMDTVMPGFAGTGIAEVTDAQQLCDVDGDRGVDQQPFMLSVVVVNKSTGPGDVTWVYEGIPVR